MVISSATPNLQIIFQHLSATGLNMTFLAVYQKHKLLQQLLALCSHYHHHVFPCNAGIREAKFHLEKNLSRFTAIAIDIDMLEFNDYEFIQFLRAKKINLPVYVTYDCVDAAINTSLETIKKKTTGLNFWFTSLATDATFSKIVPNVVAVPKPVNVSATDATFSKTMPNVVAVPKPVNVSTPSTMNLLDQLENVVTAPKPVNVSTGSKRKHRPSRIKLHVPCESLSLAKFKDPKYDDSKVTGVSTELTLGLPGMCSSSGSEISTDDEDFNNKDKKRKRNE